jgi:ElaB/YqjD/DUF883 family membrane-anchored ribosome-binding protein
MIDDMTNSTSSRDAIDSAAAVAPRARRMADDFTQTAGSVADSGRDYANDMLDKAGSKVRELRGSVEPVLGMLTSKARDFGRQTLDIAEDAKDRAQQSMTRAANVTTRYVTKQPIRSVMIAVAVGAAVALVASVARNRNDNRY